MYVCDRTDHIPDVRCSCETYKNDWLVKIRMNSISK